MFGAGLDDDSTKEYFVRYSDIEEVIDSDLSWVAGLNGVMSVRIEFTRVYKLDKTYEKT